MTFWAAVGCGILIAIVCGALKQDSRPFSLYVAAVGGVLLTAWAIGKLGGAWTLFARLGELETLSTYTTLLLKALGVGYVVKIAGDVCRDLGAAETAAKIELCGKVELLLMAMPLLGELISLALALVEESL